MQALVDAAVVVITVVIPALGFQFIENCGHKNLKEFSKSKPQCNLICIESSI